MSTDNCDFHLGHAQQGDSLDAIVTKLKQYGTRGSTASTVVVLERLRCVREVAGAQFYTRPLSQALSCIAHCQTVANENPAALWNWPSRWGVDQGSSSGTMTPERAFGAWYANGAGAPGANVTQACDFGCNPKCPLFT